MTAPQREALPAGVFARLRRHRLLLGLGCVLAALCAAESVGTVSLGPPFFTKRPLALSTAHAIVYVGGQSGLSSPKVLVETATRAGETLADMLPSPELRRYIAQAAGVPFSQLAVDGPVATDLQRTQQEPTAEKRSNQLLAEGDPYRLTIDDDYQSPVLDVTAQAPTPQRAGALANATTTALTRYLTNLEVDTGTPKAERLHVSQSQPAVGDSPGHSGIIQVAFVTFMFVLIVWCGGVWAGTSLREYLRAPASLRKSVASSCVLQSVGSSRATTARLSTPDQQV